MVTKTTRFTRHIRRFVDGLKIDDQGIISPIPALTPASFF